VKISPTSESLILLAAFASVSPSNATDTQLPKFVDDVITSLETEAVETSPKEVWSYLWKGEKVYYVAPRYCCDIPSTLYDGAGNILCHPDGGIGDAGDGRCPNFLKQRTSGNLIWRHPGLDDSK
jgi:hypothetical protein